MTTDAIEAAKRIDEQSGDPDNFDLFCDDALTVARAYLAERAEIERLLPDQLAERDRLSALSEREMEEAARERLEDYKSAQQVIDLRRLRENILAVGALLMPHARAWIDAHGGSYDRDELAEAQAILDHHLISTSPRATRTGEQDMTDTERDAVTEGCAYLAERAEIERLSALLDEAEKMLETLAQYNLGSELLHTIKAAVANLQQGRKP